MKITLEIPDYTRGAFFSYVYQDLTGLKMGVKSIDSGDLRDGAELKVDPDNEEADK